MLPSPRLFRRSLPLLALGLTRGAAAQPASLAAVGRDGWLFSTNDQPQQPLTAGIEEVAELLATAVATLRQAGIATVLAVVPCKARAYRDYLPDQMAFNAAGMQRYGWAATQLRQGGAVVPDLAAAFAGGRQAKPSELLYLKLDTHWSPAGAGCAAEETASAIAALPLPRAPGPGAVLRDPAPWVSDSYDLRSLLPPPERARFPDETVPLRRLAPSAGLLDDVAPDVVVVGNSFVQPKFGFAPALSARLGRPVGLSWKVSTIGPYQVMLDYLQSPEFRRQRPRVVVWNWQEVGLALMPQHRAFPAHAMSPAAFLDGLRKAVA